MIENKEELKSQQEELKNNNQDNPINGNNENNVEIQNPNNVNPYEHQNPYNQTNEESSGDMGFNFFDEEDDKNPPKNNIENNVNDQDDSVHEDNDQNIINNLPKKDPLDMKNIVIEDGNVYVVEDDKNQNINNAPKNEIPVDDQVIKNNLDNHEIVNPIIKEDDKIVINNAPKNEIPPVNNEVIKNNLNNQDIVNPIIKEDDKIVINNAPKNEIPPVDNQVIKNNLNNQNIENPIIKQDNKIIISNAPKNEVPNPFDVQKIVNNSNTQQVKTANPIVDEEDDKIVNKNNSSPKTTKKTTVSNQPPLNEDSTKKKKKKKDDSSEEIDDKKSINKTNFKRSYKTSDKKKEDDDSVYNTKKDEQEIDNLFSKKKNDTKKKDKKVKKVKKEEIPLTKLTNDDDSFLQEITFDKPNIFTKAKKFVENTSSDVINFAKKVPSKVSGLFDKKESILLYEDPIVLEEPNPTDQFIDSIHEGQDEVPAPSAYDIALFLLRNQNLSNPQKQVLGEKLTARINQVFLGSQQDIQNFLNTTCFHVLHGLQFHSLYDLLPKAAREQVDELLANKIKSLFFVEEVEGSLEEILELKNPRFKLPNLETDRNAIDFLKQLNTIFKVTINHPLAPSLKKLINIKMESVLNNLGGKTGEERLAFYQFYMDLINKSEFFTSEEKKTWSKVWEPVKKDAEHYTGLSTQVLNIPAYGNEARVEIERIKKTVEQNKELYSSPNFTREQRRTLSRTITRKLETAGTIKIALSECDLLWLGQSPYEIDLDFTQNSSVFIRFEQSLFFKYVDEENKICIDEIKLSEINLQLFDQQMKVNELQEGRGRNLTETELTQISTITGYKAKVKEFVEINLDNSVAIAGCDLLKFVELPDEKEFWKMREKEPLISGVAYVRVENTLYYVVAATKQWTEIEISEENLKKFDLIVKKSGHMLLQEELVIVRDITGHEPEIVQNFGEKESYSLTTRKRFQLTGPYDTKIIEETYLEFVDHYVIQGDDNDPNRVKKQVTKKKEKVNEEVIDIIKEGNDNHIVSILDIYFGLFSEDKQKNYEPDLYSINLLLKNIFTFLEPIYPNLAKIDVASILAQNDLHAMKEFLIQLTAVKDVYLKRILPGFLLLAAKQDKLLFVTEAMDLINDEDFIIKKDLVEDENIDLIDDENINFMEDDDVKENVIDENHPLTIFNNTIFSLCETQVGNNNLLIASCALAYKILDRDNLNELQNMPNFFAVFRNMAEILSPSVFLECVHVLENKTMFLEWLKDDSERTIFNNLKLRAEFSEKVRSNRVYSHEVIQRENDFVARLGRLGIQVPERGTLSNQSFAAFKYADALDLADLTYMKAKGLLSDTQIKQFLNEIGAALQEGIELAPSHIRFIALYLDREDLMRVFFSHTANREARNNGEDNVYFMDHIRPYSQRIIKAAQELSGHMSPEDRQTYSLAFATSTTQACKVLKTVGLFTWKREQNFFTNLTSIPVFTNVDSSILHYRHKGRLLLDPENEKLPFYLYAKIRQGVDSGVYSLEEVVTLIENILLNNQGNRQYAWGLFIAVFDELQNLPTERYEALERQMLIDNLDYGVTFVKDMEEFLSFNFSVKKCLNYLDSAFFTKLLDKMTDDNPHIHKSPKARKFHSDTVIKFEQIKIFAESELTKKPKEKLSNKKSSKKGIIEIERIDEDDQVIIDITKQTGLVNIAIYSTLENNGVISKNDFEGLLNVYKAGAPFDWDLKYIETDRFKNLDEDLKKGCKVPLFDKTSFSLLQVYFREQNQQTKEGYLNEILLRMAPFQVNHFLDVNEEGHSLLMVAIMQQDVRLFARIIELFNGEELRVLLAAKDRYGRNIFHYLMDQERIPENEVNPIRLIMDNTFFNWSDDAIKLVLSTDCFLNFDINGESLLITAATLGNRALFNKILETFEGEQLAQILNAKDGSGKNLLHYLLERNQLNWLTDREKNLLEVDSFLNFDDAGRTMLMNAAISGNKPLFDWVLSTFNGEDLKRLLNASDKQGCNVLYHLMKHGRRGWIQSNIIQENFSDNPIQDCGNGFTPLHYALLEALDKKTNTDETNLLMVLLNELIPGEDFQDWKNIFKIMENAGLRSLQSAVLMFSQDLGDIQVAKENPQDMLRVILDNAPKLNRNEKDTRDNLPEEYFGYKEATKFVLDQRKDQTPSELRVKGWWENGFFGNKKVQPVNVEEPENNNDDENSKDSDKSFSN